MATNTNPFYTYSATAGSSKTLQKPQDGGDNNQWGNYINTDLDEIVSAVNALSDKIADANEKTLVDFTATGSAVNHIGITNAAAGNGPTISAAGSESDVDLNVTAKGTGDINLTPGTNGDVNIPASKGITFGDDGEKIEGDGTNLTVSSSNKLVVNTGAVVDAVNFDSNTLSIDASNNHIGIGTAAPGAEIELVGTQAMFSKTGADANPLYFDLRKTRDVAHTGGTELTNNDVIGHIRFMGDDGNSYEEFASIKAVVNGGVGNADTPGDLQFHTTPDGSATPAQRMVITKAGNIGIPSSPGSSSAGFSGPIVEIEGSGPALMLQDTGTGTPLWEVGATGEKFYITDDGSNRLVIDSSGNIGIGTDAPVGDAHLAESGASEVRMQMTNSNTGHTASDGFGIVLDAAATNLYLWNYESRNMIFATNNAERGQFTSDGRFVTNNQISAGGGVFISTTGTGGDRKLSSASSGATPITLYWGNQTVTTSSDVRLKENITDTEINGLEKINQLQVKDFTWNDPTDIGINNRNVRGKWTGLIAQEIINILPFTVNAPRDEETLLPIEDALTDDGEILPWNVEFSYMVPVLVKAIQELSAKVTALENA